MSIQITVPMPSSLLSGHITKGNFHKKHAEKKALRDIALAEGIKALAAKEWEAPGKARLYIDIYYKDKRRRDILNTVNGLKPAIDGAVSAGVIADDNWQNLCIGQIKAELDREHPRCVLTFYAC